MVVFVAVRVVDHVILVRIVVRVVVGRTVEIVVGLVVAILVLRAGDLRKVRVDTGCEVGIGGQDQLQNAAFTRS